MTAYADAGHWDGWWDALRTRGEDLDWGGQWTDAFVSPLRAVGAGTVLELGCGAGHDAARLARAGFTVAATDLSAQALRQAQARYGGQARRGGAVSFLRADMAAGLPVAGGRFDAVMSNVALHMFPDAVTRRVFAEIGRVVRPGGLLACHVNALEDRPLRARTRPGTREIEPDFVLEPSGQTMHFFSAAYLRDLLRGWADVHLDLIPIADTGTGEVYKQVWRGLARR
ncbi:MAG TPA: class I SAM-dependent methyltransferase [Streptosporangiaceae bacterium]|jgi:SAM-dependent methyltransferase